MKDDRLYLIHIHECIERIESYVAGKNKQEFIDSTLIQDAVIRNLQVLAESTQHLSGETREKESSVTGLRFPAFAMFLYMTISGLISNGYGTFLRKICMLSKMLLRKCYSNVKLDDAQPLRAGGCPTSSSRSSRSTRRKKRKIRLAQFARAACPSGIRRYVSFLGR